MIHLLLILLTAKRNTSLFILYSITSKPRHVFIHNAHNQLHTTFTVNMRKHTAGKDTQLLKINAIDKCFHNDHGPAVHFVCKRKQWDGLSDPSDEHETLCKTRVLLDEHGKYLWAVKNRTLQQRIHCSFACCRFFQCKASRR